MAPMTILLYRTGIADASEARTCQVVQLGWNTVGQVVGRVVIALEGRTRFPAVCVLVFL